jgi:hypothetical protein
VTAGGFLGRGSIRLVCVPINAVAVFVLSNLFFSFLKGRACCPSQFTSKGP